MKLDELVEQLRETTNPLCIEAANALVQLNQKYQELGRSYDTMSADLLKLYDAYRKEEYSKNWKD